MVRVVKRCPDCGEMVHAAAMQCRYCRHRFGAWTAWVLGAGTVAVVLVLVLLL